MKFRTYLETITGVSIYPMISLTIFFLFFIGLLVYVFILDKKTLESMKQTPLEDGSLKKGILTLLFLSLGLTSQAQSLDDKPMGNEELVLYVLLTFLGVIAVFLVGYLVRILNFMLNFNGNKMSEEGETIDWWKRFSGTAVAVKDEKKILIEGHDYDGIMELDNPMPPWLQFLFIGTVIIGGIYATYYLGGFGLSQAGELEKELAVAVKEHEAYLAKAGAAMDENTVSYLDEVAGLEQGKSLYQTNCAACHGMAGEGGVGPNLTDEYWLHGGSVKDVFKVIKYGIPEKGMISWEKQLPPLEIQKVASYILSIKGTNPANAKEPQGEVYKEEGSEVAAHVE